MSYPKEMKRARELVAKGKVAKEIVGILERESPEFKMLSESAKSRNVYRWTRQMKNDSTNWIEAYKSTHHGRLPLIPEVTSKVVVNYSPGAMVSKNIELSIPSAQWWNALLPSQKEQILQTVDWLSQHNADWWCKSREDYIQMIRRHMPRASDSDIHITYRRRRY
jgi:hypothetical protein